MQLYIARLLRGYTQIELSRLLRMDQARLSKIENGWTEPTKMEVRKFSEGLGFDAGELEFNKKELQSWKAGRG